MGIKSMLTKNSLVRCYLCGLPTQWVDFVYFKSIISFMSIDRRLKITPEEEASWVSTLDGLMHDPSECVFPESTDSLEQYRYISLSSRWKGIMEELSHLMVDMKDKVTAIPSDFPFTDKFEIMGGTFFLINTKKRGFYTVGLYPAELKIVSDKISYCPFLTVARSNAWSGTQERSGMLLSWDGVNRGDLVKSYPSYLPDFVEQNRFLDFSDLLKSDAVVKFKNS